MTSKSIFQIANSKLKKPYMNKGTLTVKIEDKELRFSIVKQNRKSFKFVLIDEGTLKLFVPFKTTQKDIMHLIDTNKFRIQQAIQNLKNSERLFFENLLNGKLTTFYFGQEIPVRIVNNINTPSLFTEEEILIHERYSTHAKTLVTHWLMKKANEYLPKRIFELSNKTGLKFKKVLVKDTKSRWGSCSSKGTISLNWRLVMAPTQVIDYVIIHELAHTLQMNHSKEFWKIVERYKPDWKTHRSWLRKNGNKLWI